MVKNIELKNTDIIRISNNGGAFNLYSYYKKDNLQKNSFNKWAFIEYLKSIKTSKKYIDLIIKDF